MAGGLLVSGRPAHRTAALATLRSLASTGALREAIERITALLSAEPSIRVVYLFGSAARSGAAAPRDLDLAVVARPPLALPELLQLQGRLQEAARLPVDLVSLDDASIVLAHEVVEGGRCLYARSPEDETERLEGRLGPARSSTPRSRSTPAITS